MNNQKINQKIETALRKTNITKLAKAINKKFSAAEIYLVGGYFRDILLSRKSKDIDLLIRNVPAGKLQKFLESNGRVNLVGRTFGVFKFTPKKSADTIDIALPRKDFSFGTGGYRDVEVQSDAKLPIEEDLGRRDFTINALAWNVLAKKIIDQFGGLADLAKKIIRTVRKPCDRFKEDYSRILRAIRFSCQLNFEIENQTLRAIKTSIKHLNDMRRGEFVVPRETIAKELLKTFLADPVKAFDLLDAIGAIRILMPELLKMKKCPQPKNFHNEGDVWTHTRLALEILASKKFEREFGKKPNVEIILATLFHDIGKPISIVMPKTKKDRIRFDGHDQVGADLSKKIADRLKLSSYKEELIDVVPDRLHWLINHHLLLISGDPKLMRATTIERYFIRDKNLGEEFLALQFADGAATIDSSGKPSLKEYKEIKKRIKKLLTRNKRELPKPMLDGNEIMKALKIKAGPLVGKIIEELREAQLRGKVKNKTDAKRFIKTL